jgi:hypothetical protein
MIINAYLTNVFCSYKQKREEGGVGFEPIFLLFMKNYKEKKKFIYI